MPPPPQPELLCWRVLSNNAAHNATGSGDPHVTNRATTKTCVRGDWSSTSNGDGDFQMAADDRDRPPPSTNKKHKMCLPTDAGKGVGPFVPKIGYGNKAVSKGGVNQTNNKNYKQTSRLIFERGSCIFLGSKYHVQGCDDPPRTG
eukprot:CAMPEP_0196136384 /NCGR_PEP_ID=MMETSP0910-20130528/4718_1 /TAXON_ID=49265 /ORGANISM="Thalassiosira rotula, Strain GSO102" /LENGTH=144 /DNA_ID=CAMNT_0041396673 /DNA_START=329 /DNA_END=760 /DNA_ORIENTATION=+